MVHDGLNALASLLVLDHPILALRIAVSQNPLLPLAQLILMEGDRKGIQLVTLLFDDAVDRVSTAHWGSGHENLLHHAPTAEVG